MAFKDNSVPDFAQTHEYKAEHPGYATPSALTVVRTLPAALSGTSAKAWITLNPGDPAVAQPICQANANGHYQSLRAMAGMIALMQTVTRNLTNLYERGVASRYNLGDLSGSGPISGAVYTEENPIAGAQTPGWLYCLGSKYGERVAGIVTSAFAEPVEDSGGNIYQWNVTLNILRPVGGLCFERADPLVPIDVQLLALNSSGADLWHGYGPDSDPIAELARLVYSYPWHLEEDSLMNPEIVTETLTKLGHPSLSSLVLGLPDPVGTHWLRRSWAIGSGGWSKAAHITSGGVTVLAEAPGFESLRDNASGNGPGGGLRTASYTGWANQATGSEDVDPDGKFDGLLRGPVSHHLYDHAQVGNPAPWQFKRTWVGAAGISSSLGLHKYPGLWVENGFWGANGETLTEGDPGVVALRKVMIRQGARGTRTTDESVLATIGTYRVDSYDFIDEEAMIAGANVSAYFAHPLVNMAIAAGTGTEDSIVQRRGAGSVVQIKDGEGWTNFAHPASVGGKGGYGVQPGHCLVVPDSAPDGYRGRLLPVVRAKAGASPSSDPNWTGDILDSGIAGQPANYADFADKMDAAWIWRDGLNTWGDLVANGYAPQGKDWAVVRGARCSALHGIYSVAGGVLTPLTPALSVIPNADFYLADRDASTLAAEVDLPEEQPPLSLSGEKPLGALGRVFENGRPFTFSSGPFGPDTDAYSLQVDYDMSETPWVGQPTGEQPEGFIWVEGNYRFIFTSGVGTGSRTIIGVGVDGEDPWHRSWATYYNPVPTRACDALTGLCPVGSTGISAAYANISVAAPELVVTTHAFTDYDGLHGTWNVTNPTDTSPSLTCGALGVNEESGVRSYAKLATGEGVAASATDGVEHEVDITEVAQALADAPHDYAAMVLFLRAAGFTVDPGLSANEMRLVLYALWKANYSRDLSYSEGKWNGSVTGKILTYGTVGIGACHVEFNASEFTLPAEMRVN